MSNFKYKSLMTNNIIRTAMLLLFAATLASCGSKEEEKVQAEKKLQAVKIKEVTLQPFQDIYSVVGIVKPYESARISSEEGGLITYMPFDKGSRIGRGQTAARFRKNFDEANYEQAMTQFELAKSNFERVERLYNENISTEQDYTNAKFQLELAEKSLDLLETRLEKGYVVSPISGIVNEKFIGKGEVAGPGTPIISVVDVSRVKVSAGIPERYIGAITKGSAVSITFDVYPDEIFEGKVNYVSPVLSEMNRTFEIEVILPNKDGRLKPEMSANITVENSSQQDAIVLPQDLIVDFGSEKFVFVLENDIAKKKTVIIGGRKNNEVLITSGLSAGEKLIIEGFQSVLDGDKVLVIN
jgi:membrane fusion protein (multidrug efflux system)